MGSDGSEWGTFTNVNPGAGEYAILAFPDSWGTIASPRFRYKRTADNDYMTAEFTLQDLNPHTNPKGYKENYNVYKSKVSNLTAGTIYTVNSTTVYNQIKYGTAPSANIGTGLFKPGFITNLAGADVDTDTTQDPDDSGWNFNPGKTAGSKHYVFIAVPSTFSLSATGFAYQSGSCEMIIAMTEISSNMSWTNPCGYTENYDIWRSDISGEHLTDSNSSCQLGIGNTLTNKICYGASTKASSYTSADVIALPSYTVTNSELTTYSINPGASDYVVIAFPTRLGHASSSLDYENDGANAFKFDSIGCGMNEETVSVTNDYGYTENYYVYISNITNMPGTSLVVGSNSSGVINEIFFGSDTGNPINEAQIEDMDTKCTATGWTAGRLTTPSNTRGRTITFGPAGAGEYVWYCYPKRLGTVTVTIDGIPGGFQSPITLSITNDSGWTEDYYCYRSDYTDNVLKTYVFT